MIDAAMPAPGVGPVAEAVRRPVTGDSLTRRSRPAGPVGSDRPAVAHGGAVRHRGGMHAHSAAVTNARTTG
jgi:hypothetical protein